MTFDERVNGGITKEVLRGQSVYTRMYLPLYDLSVFWGTTPLFWRCSPRTLRDWYTRNVGARHLEVGVGSGYFPSRCSFPVSTPEITLLDLNQNCLDYTATRLARHRPQRVRANVLEPFPLPAGAFDSVCMNFLLHCVPGDLREKGVAFRHAATVVRPGGVVFGSTVLSSGVPVSAPTRAMLKVLNWRGIFHNDRDDLQDLRDQLATHFADHEVVVEGCVAMFRAWTAEDSGDAPGASPR
ncbi:Methyltransferase domain-containing protein [Streptoalloteichus tenebrarius]|uniref:Methyltransferase domain-containing protein n=1 Tax=Streptoalloteichus tenebrarius (strain ATCC 17920 / DSM 40477 / JCM 4838 / CBS 697.72 / NBRC 16177 / NCIMB 11028 / NRRL B-12390 / A12253. 1 / ISP 5477) TaxID=1933 RepID=A0ABT1HTN9_STRSD|nr:class I SAM-dependent methyltransferase [Streptoalloteichus tenebrarius]MCP2258874.1 Methyltransferase domain-containing protein [Streptoalloteichus tenebrarius]BFE99442.1 class I SAM-dependent methyltransferase [Streptoalloteichus tenebrarius]